MPRISQALFLMLATLLTVGLFGSQFDVAAQDKKDKKDKGDATESDAGAVKKKKTTPKSALPGAGAAKAPAQKGAAR